MPQPIYLPKEPDPFESLLPMVQNLFLLKMKHNMDMDIVDARIKARAAEKGAEERLSLEKEGRKPGPYKKGVTNPYTGIRWSSIPKPDISQDFEAFNVGGKWQVKAKPKTSVQRKSRIFVKNGKVYKQDYNFDPDKGTEANVGESYESKLPGVPFSEKVALKKTTTPTAEANVEMSRERLELTKQQELVKKQGRSLEAEQMILGNPDDPRSPTAVQQFQQNASKQPYMYVTTEKQGWFGGKTSKAEKIKLPTDKEGTQITAEDVMDTLKNNPKKFRNVQEVLKAIGAM